MWPLCPASIVPPVQGERWCRRHQRGGSAGMVKNTYVSYPPCFLLLNRPPSLAPPIRLRRTYPKGSVSLGSQVATAPLRIVFACHPYSRGRINLSMLSCRQRTAAFLFPMNCLKKNSISRFFPQGRHFLPSFSFLGNNRL
jgi:hypothetical protein